MNAHKPDLNTLLDSGRAPIPSGTPVTRTACLQELINVWCHLRTLLTEEQRTEWGISEDRSATINVMRALDGLLTALASERERSSRLQQQLFEAGDELHWKRNP